jgi:hypothetical protein
MSEKKLIPLGALFRASMLSLCSLMIPASALAAPQHNAWAAMAQSDADFAGDWMQRQAIQAIYPAKEQFGLKLAEAKRVLASELPQVSSYEGYRQALNHFVGSFQDQHLRIGFSLVPNNYQWPNFFAVYRDHRYFTAGAHGEVANDQEITSCDGKSIAQWSGAVIRYEQLITNLESSKAKAAPLIFRDSGSPFIARPQRCIIGGADVKLEWRPVMASKFSASVAETISLRDRVIAVTPFGTDGAWVRMGVFQPATQDEGKAFAALYAAAPGLRNKSVIVLDVRGNGGGPYEWFMGLLRTLYGTSYIDYYARARLQISNVLRVTPEVLEFFNADTAAETGALIAPSDGSPYDDANTKYAQALKAGQSLLVMPTNSQHIPMADSAPTSVVKAKVYVLTDYDCASACIGFVDELKRIPGAEQIGVETSVDSRTGTPFGTALPSGNGTIAVPVMTRDGRERNDNEPQRPKHLFSGNIADTAAVKAWIQSGLR